MSHTAHVPSPEVPADGIDDPALGYPEAPPAPRTVWGRLRPLVRPAVIVAVSVAVGWIIVQFVGAIDWGAVASALGRINPVQFVVLLALLGVRQTFNAVPLTRFVPGLTLGRSVQNDLSANVVGTFAPPPGDVVIRVAQFRSWGVNPVDGMAGVTLNMLAFYSIRFLAPTVGVLVLAVQEVDRGQVVAAAGSALIAVAVLVGLWLVARGDALAALLGRTAAVVVRRFKPTVDPQTWSAAVVDFRGRMADTLRSGLLPSLGALLLMVLTDGAILLAALRFVGVGPDLLSAVDVLGAFLIAYPLTIMPLAGFGILDAALLATFVEIAGLQYEPEIVAGLGVWRIITIGGPLALGGATVLLWRRRNPGRSLTHADADPGPADVGPTPAEQEE